MFLPGIFLPAPARPTKSRASAMGNDGRMVTQVTASAVTMQSFRQRQAASAMSFFPAWAFPDAGLPPVNLRSRASDGEAPKLPLAHPQ